MANLVSRDIQSITGSNLKLLRKASGLSAWDTSQVRLKEAIIQKKEVAVLEEDRWRLAYLSKLLEQRQELNYLGLDITEVNSYINSLCII